LLKCKTVFQTVLFIVCPYQSDYKHLHRNDPNRVGWGIVKLCSFAPSLVDLQS